jgi:hypothetical protein
MIVMREGTRGQGNRRQTERFQAFRRMEIGERPVCPGFPKASYLVSSPPSH